MQGRRIPDEECIHRLMAPGEYCKITDGFGNKYFLGCAPTGEHCSLGKHEVVEHDDGTITVSPSIWINKPIGWHGYLERGIWRAV